MTKLTKLNKKEIRLKLRKRIAREISYDYQRVNLRLIVGHHSDGLVLASNEPREGFFDSNDHCRLRLNDKSSGRVMRREGYDIVNKQVRLKPQIYLRNLILIELGWSRMSPVIWQQGKNVLPPIVRKELMKRNLSLAFFDKKLLDWMDNKIQTEINKMFSDYFFQFGIMPNRKKLEVHIKSVELVNDELGPIGYEMTKDKDFVSRFDEVIHNEEVTYFDEDNRKHGLPKSTNPGVDKASGAKRVKMIRGYCRDNSIEKVYLKSVDRQGVINRSETTFKENALDLILGKRELHLYGQNKLLFSDQLKKLKKIRRKRFYKVIAFSPLRKFPKKKSILKTAIKSYCGQFAVEIIRCYFKWKILPTGTSSILSSGAQRKIRQLAGDQKMFRKRERSEYVIDDLWITNNFGGGE